MLETWLENRLLPRALRRLASCSLTTLGMLTESSESAKGSMLQTMIPIRKLQPKQYLSSIPGLGTTSGLSLKLNNHSHLCKYNNTASKLMMCLHVYTSPTSPHSRVAVTKHMQTSYLLL